MIGIYKIVNIKTGDCYIGRSKDIDRRYKQHLDMALIYKYEKKIHPLYFDINKYGVEAFSLKTIVELPDDYQEDRLNQLEFEYICSCQSSYNKQPPILNVQWTKVNSIGKIQIEIGKFKFDNEGYLKKAHDIKASAEYERKILLINYWRSKAKAICDFNFSKKITKCFVNKINDSLGISDILELNNMDLENNQDI